MATNKKALDKLPVKKVGGYNINTADAIDHTPNAMRIVSVIPNLFIISR